MMCKNEHELLLTRILYSDEPLPFMDIVRIVVTNLAKILINIGNRETGSTYFLQKETTPVITSSIINPTNLGFSVVSNGWIGRNIFDRHIFPSRYMHICFLNYCKNFCLIKL